MIQDLIVEETRKEMIFLGETVLQVITTVDLGSKKLIFIRYGSAERLLVVLEQTDGWHKAVHRHLYVRADRFSFKQSQNRYCAAHMSYHR